ncbi:hypothetical protein E4U03_07815 [Rothia nasimurium]|uniref:Uncharacterized protein n=1 Tax=Rothia nasimurium TaxID=85336 RepID=A0A4Y9F2P8_9MICC|nr:hypothetical protein [Rothia nasimurium]MBF0808514.1 hypothetical protein [Rothia nasimurium]TFU21908.1 hypothetical protein E4U03_07815 [Rothia nasimurium]
MALITWEDMRHLTQKDIKDTLTGHSITGQSISKWLGASATDEEMEVIASSVTSYVNSLPSIDRDTEGNWAATTLLGATMLGARLYKRRASPNGIESFAEIGNTYISRYDSDIARLLHIEAFRKPLVA